MRGKYINFSENVCSLPLSMQLSIEIAYTDMEHEPVTDTEITHIYVALTREEAHARQDIVEKMETLYIIIIHVLHC